MTKDEEYKQAVLKTLLKVIEKDTISFDATFDKHGVVENGYLIKNNGEDIFSLVLDFSKEPEHSHYFKLKLASDNETIYGTKDTMWELWEKISKVINKQKEAEKAQNQRKILRELNDVISK